MPEMAEPTTRYEVRYRSRPAWEVGERTPEHMPGEHYPDDYAGKMIDMREVDSDLPSLRHMEDKTRPVIELDLTRDEVAVLKSRTAKIDRGEPVQVTFEDRWGAVAEPLRARFVDAEIAERKLELDSHDAEAEEFGRVAYSLMRALPAPDVHTGTGWYYTKAVPAHLDRTQSGAPAGQVITLTVGGLGTADAYLGGYVTNATRAETRAIVSHTDDTTTLMGSLVNWLDTDDLDVYDAWSTVQGHQDQLWTDQSTAGFTLTQYGRVFAGTYDENVTPNGGLLPGYTTSKALIIEGDPTDSRDNILVQPTGGTHGIFVNCDAATIRHMKYDATGAGNAVTTGGGCSSLNVEDCVLIAQSTGRGINVVAGVSLIVQDCDIQTSGNGLGISMAGSNSIIKRCTFKQTGAGSSYGINVGNEANAVVEGCTISGYAYGVSPNLWGGFLKVSNTAFYDCTTAVYTHRCAALVELVNCIVDSCTYVFFDIAANWNWPDEATEGNYLAWFTQRNNCFYGYTSFAAIGGATKTYAQWIAFDLVDADGDIDATDPLLTGPGTGDFSLAADSPCKRTGAGSGVPTDVDGVAYDMQNPDMGAVSSGSGTSAPSTGIITTVPGTVTVPITLGGAPYVRARLLDVDGVQEDEQTEASEGAGTIALTAASAGWKYVVIWGVSAGDDPIGEPGSIERIWVPPAAVTVYYSIDGGTSWVAAAGDAWPVTAGEHIVRLQVRDAELSRRIMVKIESTDADVWGVRRIIVKGNRKLQEMSLE